MLSDFGNNILIASAFAFLVGVLLGGFYFSGLWWTVRRLSSSSYIAPLFLGSMLLRTSVVIAGFYFVLGGDWRQLLWGLLGFVTLRWFAIRFVRRIDGTRRPVKGSGLMAEPALTPKQKKSYAP